MLEVKAVLWDLDGTLVNSEEYHWQSWRDALAPEGLSITYDQFLGSFGMKNDPIMRLWLGDGYTPARSVRIAEAKDMPIVQRLDRAVPAERHSRPRMGLHLGVAAVVSLALGVLGALGREYARSLAPTSRLGRATHGP